MPTTFAVSDVKPGTRPIAQVPTLQAVRELILRYGSDAFFAYNGGQGTDRSRVESCFRYHGKLISSHGIQPLIRAVSIAYSGHYPLSLSPDALWLTLAQGFATHIAQDPQRYRERFVSFADKKSLRLRRDDFVKGSPENPWSEVFADFSMQIREHIGAANHELIAPQFSTTGPIERAAFEVVLMDTLKHYFKYEMFTLCGIPSITLEGEPADWRSIRERAEAFAAFDLSWWTDCLLPILDEFVAASEGRPHRLFWRCLYRLIPEESGCSERATGWIVNLFPYIKDPVEENEALFDPRPILELEPEAAVEVKAPKSQW